MRILESFFLENKSVSSALDFFSDLKGHQGSIIRFSEKFLLLYELQKRDPERFARFYDPFFVDDRYNFDFYLNRLGRYVSQDFVPRISDSEISDFYDFRKKYPEIKPYDLEISIFNNAPTRGFEVSGREYSQNIENNDFNINIRKNARSFLLSGSRKYHEVLRGGISIGNHNRYGSIGGIMKDRNTGKVYAMTCAHVVFGNEQSVFQPSLKDSQNARIIGNVVQSGEINWSAPGIPCNRNNRWGISNMDVAIIELNEEIQFEYGILNLGRISGKKTLDEIDQNMEVEFNGRTSNSRSLLSVGGIAVSYKVSYDDEELNTTKQACFTELIEVRRKNPFLIGNYSLSKPPVRPGDSGSWICSNDENGYNWCGMLIAGDYDRGYFLSAEKIDLWLRRHGYDMEYCENYDRNWPHISVDLNIG